MKYSNPQTQAYIDSLYSIIAENEKRIENMRQVNKVYTSVYKRLAWTSVKIADLSADEQSKIIRLTKGV